MSLTLWVWSRSWGYLTWPPLTWTIWTWRQCYPTYRSWSTGMDRMHLLTGSLHLSQTLIGQIVDMCIRTDLYSDSPDLSFQRIVKSLKLLKIRSCILISQHWLNDYRPHSFYAIFPNITKTEHILHLILLLWYLTRAAERYSINTWEIFLLTVWLSYWMISSHCWMTPTWSVWPLTLRLSSEGWPLSRPSGTLYQGQVIFHDKT